MSLEKRNMPLSAKQVSIMDKNDKFDYNHIIQRGLVWERSRKSDLIESMIIGYPIPPIYCRRDREEGSKKKGDSTYVVMDGKQRLTTIASFIQGTWALTTLAPMKYTSYTGDELEADISGMTFAEIPEELQDAIKDTIINLIYFEDITPAEERELFKRLNAGKPLSTKARVLANCADLENILDIGDHSLFNEMLTENALSQKNQVSIVMKIWAMLNKPITEVSFEGKYFNPMVESTVVTYDERLIIRDVLDYFKNVHATLVDRGHKKEAKKFYTETHLVSFVPFCKKAYEDGYDEEMFSDWVATFFADEDEKEISEYYTACSSGSAKNENIQIRNNILSGSYAEFFRDV